MRPYKALLTGSLRRRRSVIDWNAEKWLNDAVNGAVSRVNLGAVLVGDTGLEPVTSLEIRKKLLIRRRLA